MTSASNPEAQMVIPYSARDPIRIFNLSAKIRDVFYFYTPDGQRVLLWYYDASRGIWLVRGEEMVRAIVSRSMEPDYEARVISSVVQKVKDDTRNLKVQLGKMAPQRIVLANGVYDLDTGEFSTEFRREDYQIVALPYDYDPEAKCPRFEQALEEWLPNNKDHQKALVEWMGYNLVQHHRYEILMILVGDGANGKTRFLNAMIMLLGKENVSGRTLQELATDRFAAASLFGKLANICADISAEGIRHTGMIKTLTGGDLRVSAQYKHKDSFEFANSAKLTFSANQVPMCSDTTNAWYRRPYLVEFKERFTAENRKKDPELDCKLQAELSGIFNLAVAGYRRLVEQGSLTGDKGTEEKRREFNRLSDPLRYFFDRFCKPDVEGRITYGAMSLLYKKVNAKYGKRPPVGQRTVTTRRPEYCDHREPQRIAGVSQRFYEGITIDLKEYYQEIGKPRQNVVQEMIGGYLTTTVMGEEAPATDPEQASLVIGEAI